MSNNLKEILVIDVESPKDSASITEIGIARLVVATGEILRGDELFAYDANGAIPQDFWGVVDYSTKQLITFKEALDVLRQCYHSKRYTWASWGYYDLNSFERQCYSMGLEYPFSQNHINVKLLFSLQQGSRVQVGMKYALEHLNMPLEGTHDSGRDDAYNIAKILKFLMNR